MKDFSLNSFIAGVMLGALAVGGWVLSDNPSLLPTPTLAGPLTSTSTNVVPQSGAVEVSNQPPGATTAVKAVTVAPPGVWVAVRETNGADLGNVLGALRVGGPRSDVSISLLRATEPGRAYAVELYRDDNNGQFDPGTNSVYVDFETGSRVIAYFNTTN
jgi:hypothetical protein